MPSDCETSNAKRRTLNGWKEIADHIGVSVRSAQRSETEAGLPVRRIRTATGKIVYAEPDEIDDWRRQIDAKPTAATSNDSTNDGEPPVTTVSPTTSAIWPVSTSIFQNRAARTVGIGAAIVLGFAFGLAAGRQRTVDRNAVQFRLLGRSLEALNGDGAIVWSYVFDRDVSSPPVARRPVQTIDLNGDGRQELIVSVRPSIGGDVASASDAVYCFTRGGALKWSVIPDQTITFGDRTFGPPWVFEGMARSTSGPPRLWLSFSHHTWWPGFILEVSRTGQVTMRYVQDGYLRALAHRVTPTGAFLVLAGLSHRLSGGTLVFLGDDDAAATFPSEGVEGYRCLACPAGVPARILAFPANAITRDESLYPWFVSLTPRGPQLEAGLLDGTETATVVLDADLSLASMTFSADRHTPRVVREWTPRGRWRERIVGPADPQLHP